MIQQSEKITEQSIRKFAQQNSLSQLHNNYQDTAKNRPDLKNHNGFYGNIIYFLKFIHYEETDLSW